MAFGLVDVCARANRRGETSGDVAARRRRGSIPPASCRLLQPLAPSLPGGKVVEDHTHGGGSWYQADGWKEVEDRVEGCFHVARERPCSSRHLQEK